MPSQYQETVFKEMYLAELDHMHKLDGQTAFPATVLTLLLGVGAYYLTNLPPLGASLLSAVYLLLLSLFFVSLVAGLWCVVKSYYGVRYRFLSAPSDVAAYVAGLQSHYSFFHEPSKTDEKIDGDLRLLLIKQYQESGEQNRRTNVSRMQWLHWTTRAIVWALIFLAASVVPFISLEEKPTHKVQIVSTPEARTGADKPELQRTKPPADKAVKK